MRTINNVFAPAVVCPLEQAWEGIYEVEQQFPKGFKNFTLFLNDCIFWPILTKETWRLSYYHPFLLFSFALSALEDNVVTWKGVYTTTSEQLCNSLFFSYSRLPFVQLALLLGSVCRGLPSFDCVQTQGKKNPPLGACQASRSLGLQTGSVPKLPSPRSELEHQHNPGSLIWGGIWKVVVLGCSYGLIQRHAERRDPPSLFGSSDLTIAVISQEHKGMETSRFLPSILTHEILYFVCVSIITEVNE